MHVPQAPRSFQSCAAALLLLLSDSASLSRTCLMHHAPSELCCNPSSTALRLRISIMHMPHAPRSFQSCATTLLLLLSDSASQSCTCFMHHAPSRAVLRPPPLLLSGCSMLVCFYRLTVSLYPLTHTRMHTHIYTITYTLAHTRRSTSLTVHHIANNRTTHAHTHSHTNTHSLARVWSRRHCTVIAL